MAALPCHSRNLGQPNVFKLSSTVLKGPVRGPLRVQTKPDHHNWNGHFHLFEKWINPLRTL